MEHVWSLYLGKIDGKSIEDRSHFCRKAAIVKTKHAKYPWYFNSCSPTSTSEAMSHRNITLPSTKIAFIMHGDESQLALVSCAHANQC